MPEIKNTFSQGKMNKDLDERIIPNGQYRDAMNIQVSTSEGSDVGTVQNILGNTRVDNIVDVNGAKCIGSVSNEKNNKLYWFIKSNNLDAILEYDVGLAEIKAVLVDTKANTSDAVLKFGDNIITGINIIDNLLLWTDGINEPRRINIERCKLGNSNITSLSSANHTKLVIQDNNTSIDITEEHITSIKKNPLRPLSVVINQSDISNESPLFEKIFPRFSYRYKYEDGEYSTYAPFTDVVFKSLWGVDPAGVTYDENNAYGTKEPYNNAMRNMINSIELKDFISPGIPEDVIQIDLLYKQEDSSVIYLLEVLKQDDEKWVLDGSNPDSEYKGSFTVTTENIYSAIPESQLLRPWDNIPKTALAQEVTGNRIVYGNYTQQYDINTSPKITSNFALRDIGSFDDGGLPSIKSQRDYQIGVVYGDKYGRETPVFTTEDASLTIPWGNQFISQQLTANIKSNHPEWADYYKFFVKETSGEYYNLVMDAVYMPTKEDLSKEDHVWLSFSSSDRNKVSEEDYIILKKKVGDTSHVTEENKYRILDIKNEAPESIKYKYLKLGEIDNSGDKLNETSGNGGIFFDEEHRPRQGGDFIYLQKTNWQAEGNNGMSLTINDELTESHDLFISFFKDSGTELDRTERFRISSIRVSSTNVYIIQLEKPIPVESNFDNIYHKAGTSTDELHGDVSVVIERKIKKNLEAFSGRFFVKVFSRGIVSELQDANEIQSTWVTTNLQNLHWHSDVPITTYDATVGLINNGAHDPSGLDSTDETKTIAGISSNITNTEAGWNSLLTSVIDTSDDDGVNQFFIDNMYMASVQPSSVGYARTSGHAWYGGNPDIIDDIMYGGLEAGSGFTTFGPNEVDYVDLTSNFPGYYHVGVNQYPYYEKMAIPRYSPAKTETILNTPGSSGENMINGIPGIISTNDDHNSSTGIRRWKKDLFTNDLTMWDYGNDSVHDGKQVVHISFLAPGEDLHDGNWYDLTDVGKTPQNMQGIHGGGAFVETDGSSILLCERSRPSGQVTTTQPYERSVREITTFVPELERQGNPNYKVRGYDPRYDDKHNNQWKPEWSGGVYNAKVEAFVNALKTPGQRFRFKDDPTGSVYTIHRTREKRIYNHTPWRRMYRWDTSGTQLVAKGDSVEEAGIDWANNPTDAGKQTDFEDAVVRFGGRHNRRICYIVHLEDAEFPVSGATNQGDPIQTDTNSAFNSLDANTIEFIDENFNLLDGDTSENPAIWETEPKDNVDIDIYYEAGQAYPITLTENNRELFAPIGCKVKLHGTPTLATGDPNVIGDPNPVSFPSDIHLSSWLTQGSANIMVLDTGVDADDGSTTNLIYNGVKVVFTRDDGSFTTGQIVDGDPDTAVQHANPRKEFEIIPMADGNHGLSWHNCFSFGNGIESNRIRDDFNAMTLSNGVRANTTIERPYKEEHRKNGLIYSGLYNSTNGINNLNQFIMAEKITKDLNPTYGSIQKLYSRVIRQSSSLIAFCEDKVVSIISNKNALYNADGNPQVVASNAVLGDANPFVGDYGISQNPESFARDSYRAYFTDKQRGAVLRLSMDGLTPISDAGMHDYFRDSLKIPNKLIGTYDSNKKDYNITLSDYLPSNVIINGFLEGQEQSSTNEYFNTTEYILNGNFASGTDISNPTAPVNDADNSDLDSETTITNHDTILTGSIQGVLPEIIPVDWTFENTTNNDNIIYNMDHQTVPGSTNPDPFGIQSAGNTPSNEQVGEWNNNNPLPGGMPGQGDGVYWVGETTGVGLVNDGYGHRHIPYFQNTAPGAIYTFPGSAKIIVKLQQLGNGFVNSDMSSVFTSAINSTIFHDEYFKVSLRVRNYDGGTSNNNAWDDDATVKVELRDIDTNANIPAANFIPAATAETVISAGTTDTQDIGYIEDGFAEIDVAADTDDYDISFYFAIQGVEGTHFSPVTNGVQQQIIPVINDFSLHITNSAGDTNKARIYIKRLKVEKLRRAMLPGSTIQQTAQPDIPDSDIAAWAEVEHAVVNGWSTTNGHIVLNQSAINQFGSDTGSGNSTSYTLANGSTGSYIVGTPNGVTTYNQNTTGNYTSDDFLQAATDGSDAAYLTQDLSTATGSGHPLVVDNWYEVRLIGVTETGGTKSVFVMDALNQTAYTADGFSNGDTLPGHLGEISDESIKFNDEGGGEWIARWEQKFNSNLEELKMYFYNFQGTIDRIEFADITDKQTGGTASNWNTLYNPNPEDDIYHYYSPRKKVYYHGNRIRWGYDSNGDSTVDVFGEEGNYAVQATNGLPVTNDGYELRLQISLFNNGVNAGGLKGYVTGSYEAVDPGHTYGFEFDGITQGGYYRVRGNLDGTTIPTIDRTDSTYENVVATVAPITASIKDHPGDGHADKVLFRPRSTGYKGTLNYVSLKDITNYFATTSQGSWVFDGFDPQFDNYISWDSGNENIVFTDAPIGVSLQQGINNHNLSGTVQLKFDVSNVTGGSISGYFYNSNGEGFTFGPITNNTNFDSESDPAYRLTMGDSTASGGELLNTFVIYVDTTPGPFSGTLDNFELYRIYPDWTPTTITYSEDVKGWVSFKSFIPESGVNVSKQYYTFNNGELWQHHIEQFDANDEEINRNTFYNNFVKSSVTTILNEQPSLIKIYNTLNYEGTQSKINQYITDSNTGLSNESIYNLNAKDGWYAESIITDKQSGSIKEFIEKEGKWFNYIKGTKVTDSTTPSTADLSFQGLGVVANANILN